MNHKTLFLVQSTYANTDKILSELPNMATPEDYIVILGEALLKISPAIPERFTHLYCLSHEQSLLNEDMKNQINLIEYAEFADLILQFERCISLK